MSDCVDGIDTLDAVLDIQYRNGSYGFAGRIDHFRSDNSSTCDEGFTPGESFLCI